MFKTDDQIVISSQPTNQCVRLTGEQGKVIEICNDDLVSIECFNKEGILTGTGRVPPECLTLLIER